MRQVNFPRDKVNRRNENKLKAEFISLNLYALASALLLSHNYNRINHQSDRKLYHRH